jgi:hypothetical protein
MRINQEQDRIASASIGLLEPPPQNLPAMDSQLPLIVLAGMPAGIAGLL